MKNNWTTTKLVAVGSLAVLDIIVGLAASVITATTGITMASGVITSITEPLILMVCLLVVEKRGSALLFMTIVGVLALPINYAGPPGFFAKLPILIALGFCCDVIHSGLKRINLWLDGIIIGAFLCIWYTFAVALVGKWLQIPGIDNFLYVMPIIYLVASVSLLGAIGGALGVVVYKRIQYTTVVSRIRT